MSVSLRELSALILQPARLDARIVLARLLPRDRRRRRRVKQLEALQRLSRAQRRARRPVVA